MKKFGFTLAEVLITLGIIGVVAALTTPALVKNSGQAKIGPSLSKFVNTWETGCEQMLTDESTNKLSNVASDFNELLEKLSKNIVMSPVDDTVAQSYTLYSPDGSKNYNPTDNHYTLYQLKDGSLIMLGSDNSNKIGPNGAFLGVRYKLIVDINGIKGNNKTGSEVFFFYVDNSGVLIPFGSNMHKYLYKNATGSELTGNKYICNAAKSNLQSGLSCTGAIADNGWKAEY